MSSSMHPAQETALRRAMTTLVALEAEFHIRLPDGTEHGKPVGASKRKRGSLGPSNKAYLEEQMAGIKPGDVKDIAPQEGDTLARLQSCLASRASALWGNGTYTTVMDKPRGVVSIFREL